jgi:hypothetical protein
MSNIFVSWNNKEFEVPKIYFRSNYCGCLIRKSWAIHLIGFYALTIKAFIKWRNRANEL